MTNYDISAGKCREDNMFMQYELGETAEYRGRVLGFGKVEGKRRRKWTKEERLKNGEYGVLGQI